ncbi:target of Myb1 membrane trafficking protein-like isoform X1 [Salvelinus fontinalis]|uniref:target of Myb1 membrane trafficking protein-like isoform X1 n=1 Tax=Salvelinus fontinalis TaxID=8038 RepID=UPI00248600D6|nr:target of Myb1 membrane trafficking protein-like isoform X1 [Salvelinus fontinalis]
MEFLTGNPFTTPVGQRIEYATSSSLQSEDWALNMDICDIINETEEGPRDAYKAIKKRIVGNKNFREVMLALTVLEACVKNCGHRFHVLVSTREFVEGVLVRSILPKNNPPLVLHDRVLSLIQAWADAFRSSPALTGVVSVYEDLRRKGLEFPMTELDGYSPIHTPNRTVPDNGPTVTVSAAPSSPRPVPISPQLPASQQSGQGPLTFTPYQVKKLKTDLGVVRGNLTVMSDMMSQLDPATAKNSDTELLQELYAACKDMQDKIMELVPRLSEEKLTEELLVVNDEINATFTRYQRFQRQRATQQSPTYVNLIDLSAAIKPVVTAPTHSHLSRSTVDTVSSQMTGLSMREFDDFAQNRSISQTQLRPSERNEGVADSLTQAQNTRLHNNETGDSPDSTTLSSSTQFDWMMEKGMIPVSQTSVMDDIEKWLDVDEEDDMADSEGVTSEEFDRFLAERVRAAERLPSLKASSRDDNNHSES